MTPHESDSLVGQTLNGKYRLDALLGKGGMGAVYRATHLHLKKVIALKLIRRDIETSPGIVERFTREAQALSTLNHSNIVPVYDFEQTPEGTRYFTMELVEGITLAEVIQQHGPLPATRIVMLLAQVCSALAQAHKHLLVHRDLKPQNILLTSGPGGEVIKLLDFGIAKSLDDGLTQITEPGSIIGTPPYMSPEQITRDAIDGRSDLYALGVILYQMLVGEVPFSGSSGVVIQKHLHEDPVLPTRRRPDLSISPELEAIAMRCLQKDPAQRFQTATELFDALALLDHTRRSSVEPTGPGYASGGDARTAAGRGRRMATMMGALVVGAIAIVAVYSSMTPTNSEGNTPTEPRPPTTPRVEMRPTEVTNAQFAQFVGRHPEWRRDAASLPPHDGDYLKLWTSNDAPSGLGTHPVVYVTWNAADAYCRAEGARLPNEREWEDAARAGSATEYWWGDRFLRAHANAAGTATEPVGQPQHANALGLYDMAGNVWEWTSTTVGGSHVVRGGSWQNPEEFSKSTSRQLLKPGVTAPDLGFRCAK